MAEGDSWDAESFEPDQPATKPVVVDKWDGEDDEEDVKDNWDDEEEVRKDKKTETKPSEKKKLSDKIKEKQNLQRKKQEELRKRLEESQESTDLTPEEELSEELRVKTPQAEEADAKSAEEADLEPAEEADLKPAEEADLKPADEAHGVSNNIAGIDAISPSSKDDFSEFEKLLKDKICPLEKSIHYSGFLESLFRDLCLSLEVDDLKKINTSITVLLGEKQKQEKQLNKGKKKKKGVVPAGGLKAKMKDDLADYGGFEGGYAQDYEDFM